jgi:Ankyrin repeats (3 copies)
MGDETAWDPAARFEDAAYHDDVATIGRLVAADPGVVDRVCGRMPNLIATLGQHGHTAAVPLLISLGFDVNAYLGEFISVNPPLGTALHYAARAGDTDLARLLLAHGADPDIFSVMLDGTPLDWARRAGQRPTEALLKPLTARRQD